MQRDEKTLWNQKYREGSHTSLEPDLFLVSAYAEYLAALPPGTALDVAGGVGRHTLWLAERGWKIKLMDVSDVGIEFARKNIPTEYTSGTVEQRQFQGGPSHPMHLLRHSELLDAFASLRILHYHESIHQKGVAELAGRKE